MSVSFTLVRVIFRFDEMERMNVNPITGIALSIGFGIVIGLILWATVQAVSAMRHLLHHRPEAQE